MNAEARPFVKWAGGKRALLDQILKRLPTKIVEYYEPFLGGGAVFFALANEKRFEKATLGDANSELAVTYRTLARHPDELIAELQALAKKHCEDFYYTVRARNPYDLALPARAARLSYLNKTGFNGLYRVNRKGAFNVSFGDYKNPTICDDDALRAAAKALAGVGILDVDFEETVLTARRGDAVYFDPPYVPVSTTANFTSYSKAGFGPADQERLRDVAEKLIARGVYVLLSNSDTPLVWKLYKGFELSEVRARRSINSNGGKRGTVGELLISRRSK